MSAVVSDIILDVPEIGFGANGINSEKIFAQAIEQGYRLFDSADLYGNS